MDDQGVNVLLGKTQAQLQAETRFKEELERRSEDLINIYNPLTNELSDLNFEPSYFGQGSYICFWNSYGNEFPSEKVTICKRYIAEKALYEIINIILITKAKRDIEAINLKRHREAQPKLTPKEASQIEESYDYKITESKNRAPWVKVIWKGIYKENRYDFVLPQKRLAPQDTRPIDEQLIEQLDRKSLIDQEVAPEPAIDKDFIEGENTIASNKKK